MARKDDPARLSRLRSGGWRFPRTSLTVFVLLLTTVNVLAAAAGMDRWTLQSNFWVSLHETLLHATQIGPVPEPTGMTDADRRAWHDALEFYESEFTGRSALRDEEMMRIGWELSLSTEAELSKNLPDELTQALQRVAPVYRTYYWPLHDRAARLWIAVGEALLSETADELIAAHEVAYGVPFVEKIRVDVTPYAGRFGGYTTTLYDEAHTRVSCLDKGQQGFASLEILFHEPSHAIVGPSFGVIGPQIEEIEQRLGIETPRSLWHAILFYTSGELTRRALACRGVTYEPFTTAMFEGPYSQEADAVTSHWQAFLDAKISRDEALELIVRQTGKPLDPEGSATPRR
ncbi:MAG: hypothetical protein P8Y93_04340 [Acidobacteriota bacterium]